MAQFDVHRNPGRTRTGTPYFVIVQSRRYDSHARRVVIPLVLREALASRFPEMTPVFRIEGRDVALDPLQMVSIAKDALGPHVGSLADDESSGRIINAIDLVISRAWG
jgi:toxin CcdB